MTTVDNLWFLASEAEQQAQQVYHRLTEDHQGYVEYESTRTVSRYRFKTVANRIKQRGVPFGAHTLAFQPSGEILLVRHSGVDLWVVPGGEVHDDETFREGAKRELREEAGIGGSYDGLGILGRITFRCGEHTTWGVLPIYQARGEPTEPEVRDPDDEIVQARWFQDLPEDTRDRHVLEKWRHRNL